MKILLVAPFFSGSHQSWALGYQAYSQHEINICSLPGRHWKWRMYGGAVTLARQFRALDFMPDLVLTTDMLDLTTFMCLAKLRVPTAIYFHENQITYPWSPTDADVSLNRNNQYGFINYTSALAADVVLFNSHYHQSSFLGALPDFLRQFPDYRELATVDEIAKKSKVLHLGLALQPLTVSSISGINKVPVLLWNHRWEYDKNPELFFRTLFRLKNENLPFQLIVLGSKTTKYPKVFEEAKTKLATEIIHWGYAETFEDYAQWLAQADLLPVTSNQDFFGGSVVEAIYSGVFPILPNRLAYPEHLLAVDHDLCLYDNSESGFYKKLKNTMQQFTEKSLPKISQSVVKKYDWQKMAPKYDKTLASISATN